MSDAAPVLDRQSIDLLFSVIETPNAAIAGVVLTDYYGSVSRELQESGLLVPDGHEVTTASLADHDDAPVTLTWSDDGSGYGYFSSATGWVAVPNDRIARYRVNLTSFVERLLSRIDWPSKTGLIPLIPDTLWEIGDVRIEGRTKRIPVWIGRRLHDPEIWAAVQEVMRSRPAAGLRVIFASTATGRLPAETIAGNVIIAVRDVIDHGAGLAVDPAILAARIAGSQRRGDRPLSHSADYSVITVHGKDYAFTRKQRSVVRHLVEAFEAGSPRCLTAKVLEEAENAPSVIHSARHSPGGPIGENSSLKKTEPAGFLFEPIRDHHVGRRWAVFFVSGDISYPLTYLAPPRPLPISAPSSPQIFVTACWRAQCPSRI